MNKNLNVPQRVGDQKVELTLADLAGLVQKPGVNETEQKVAKDDYLRLAELKLDKIFKPKIQKLTNRVEKMTAARTAAQADKDEAMKREIDAAQNDAEEFIGKITAAYTAIAEAGAQLGELQDELTPVYPLDVTEIPECKVQGVSGSADGVAYFVQVAGRGDSLIRIAPLTAWLKERRKRIADAQAALDTAKNDLDVMCKSHTKAKGEIVSEVEMGLLESMISKSEPDQKTATEINERLEKQVATMYLPEGSTTEDVDE